MQYMLSQASSIRVASVSSRMPGTIRQQLGAEVTSHAICLRTVEHICIISLQRNMCSPLEAPCILRCCCVIWSVGQDLRQRGRPCSRQHMLQSLNANARSREKTWWPPVRGTSGFLSLAAIWKLLPHMQLPSSSGWLYGLRSGCACKVCCSSQRDIACVTLQ